MTKFNDIDTISLKGGTMKKFRGFKLWFWGILCAILHLGYAVIPWYSVDIGIVRDVHRAMDKVTAIRIKLGKMGFYALMS